MKKKMEHVIRSVEPGSIAEEMEMEAGDVLVSINGEQIRDVFDYRFLIRDEYIEVLIRKPDGEEWELEIEKEYEDDLGLVFENELMSEYRSCSNKCIFCFIDQMPPGMRKELYFKDDDSRLSFLQGNYITLTNMTDEDIDRIVRMQLAPINISVHTTNPSLRCKMLNNRFAGEKLKLLDRLYEGHVEMNGQIVCCKGVNDGKELRRTIEDLSCYLPLMRSVSVVPAGITKFREKLYPLEMFDAGQAGEIIDLIEGYQQGFYEKYGLHFVHASDEWYLLAGRELPEQERYDDYIQLENGVGMLRLLISEFEEAAAELAAAKDFAKKAELIKRSVTIVTGKLAEKAIKELAKKAEDLFPHLTVRVKGIRNDFFGETITVSGLITGTDLTAQLLKEKEQGTPLGDVILISANMVRTLQERFLDDITISQVQEKLGTKLVVVETTGRDLLVALTDPDYRMERCNENYVYLSGYAETHYTS